MTESAFAYHRSPIGLIEIGATDLAVTRVAFVEAERPDAPTNDLALGTERQLAEYFAGTRRVFDLRLALYGTAFQLRVWGLMLGVSVGQTASYQQLARALGQPHGARAVGAAAGRNPVAIVVPCHRVVGSNGGLTGYAGGVWRKEWLLRHEAAILV
jgi:methylated-DNA-[protein]-cysteine S-methyltransferase